MLTLGSYNNRSPHITSRTHTDISAVISWNYTKTRHSFGFSSDLFSPGSFVKCFAVESVEVNTKLTDVSRKGFCFLYVCARADPPCDLEFISVITTPAVLWRGSFEVRSSKKGHTHWHITIKCPLKFSSLYNSSAHSHKYSHTVTESISRLWWSAGEPVSALDQ